MALPDDERAGTLRLRYHTLGREATLKRRAERARLAAERDSLRLLTGDYAYLLLLDSGMSMEKILEKVGEQAAVEREQLSQNERRRIRQRITRR